MLPPELISLVHYIELNKVGWWEKALQQLIMGAIWLSGKSLTSQDIIDYYQKQFRVTLEPARVKKHLDLLCSSNMLIRVPDERYKISETALKEFEKRLKEAEEVESKSKNKFFEILSKCCPSLDAESTWQKVNKELVIPIIQIMGARTYELLAGVELDLDRDMTFHGYIEKYPPEIRKSLQTAITTFLDPKDATVRAYILNHLNSFFFLEAGNLKEDTLKTISRLSSLKPTFLIFVDTNFLFSILELHENPSNEAALLLQELIRQLSDKVTAKLYVLPITVSEAKRVFIAYSQQMNQVRLTTSLAEASLDMGLKGIVQKYFEEIRKKNIAVSADLYFGPYIKDLISILKTKNVELFNEKTEKYKTDRRVIDDILMQMEFEKKHQGRGAKSYEQWEHDMVLWHFVHDKRPSPLESPLDTKYWIATVDFRFLGFDSYKKSTLQEPFQTCLHPSTLVQMLQFWVPRTAQFEEAMLSSLRLPFLIQEFDPNSERVTIRIIEALGRYENIGDLSKETIAAILMNDALRQKLAAESDITKQVELVREALIEEHRRIEGKLQEAVKKSDLLAKEIDQKDEIIRGMAGKIDTLKENLLSTEHQLETAQRSEKKLEERISQLEAIESRRIEKQELRSEIAKFAAFWIVMPVIFIALFGFYLSRYFFMGTRPGFWGPAIGIWSFLLIIWVWLADKKGQKKSRISDWSTFKIFHKTKNWVLRLFGLLLLGVLGNAIWDSFKKILP